MATTHFKRSGIQVGVMSVLTTLNMPAAAVEAADLASDSITAAKIAAATISLGSGTHGVAMGKFDGIYGSVNFVTLDVTLSVVHGLGRTPIAYALVGSDKAANVYDGATHTATHLKVKCDTTTVTAKLIIW